MDRNRPPRADRVLEVSDGTAVIGLGLGSGLIPCSVRAVPEAPDLAPSIPVGLDIAAVALGAVQGAVFATRMADERRLDVVGVAVVGIATGLGGGLARDLLIDQLPAALADGRLLLTAVAPALVGMLLAPDGQPHRAPGRRRRRRGPRRLPGGRHDQGGRIGARARWRRSSWG